MADSLGKDTKCSARIEWLPCGFEHVLVALQVWHAAKRWNSVDAGGHNIGPRIKEMLHKIFHEPPRRFIRDRPIFENEEEGRVKQNLDIFVIKIDNHGIPA